jgi:hypothetical protein
VEHRIGDLGGGVTVRVARMVPETGQLDRGDLGRQITERTRLVAIGAASNERVTHGFPGHEARRADANRHRKQPRQPLRVDASLVRAV